MNRLLQEIKNLSLSDVPTNPEEKWGLFRDEDINLEEAAFEQFFQDYHEELRRILEKLLALWSSKEFRQLPGHGQTHIAYDLLEYLQFWKNVELPKSELYITLFGSLLHDLGRFPEDLLEERSGAMSFEGKEVQLHAALSAWIGYQLFEKELGFTDSDDRALQAFVQRVLGAVAMHGGANEERDPAAHHVQSLDRLAGILGVRTVVRNFTTDVYSRGARIYPDPRFDYSQAFPLFSNLPAEDHEDADSVQESWTNLIHYVEMPMRNLFKLSTDFTMKRAEGMRAESGLILKFLTSQGSELFEQTFAPELFPEMGEYEFPKSPLPEPIWEGIKEGPSRKVQDRMVELQGEPIMELAYRMLEQQARTLSSKTKDGVVETILSVKEFRPRLHKAISYIVTQREENAEQEKAFLEELEFEEGDLAELAEIVADEVEDHYLWNN